MALLPAQGPEAVLKHALRLVGREVILRDAARRLELYPHRRAAANELFALASLLRQERLNLLVQAGLLESVERWTR